MNNSQTPRVDQLRGTHVFVYGTLVNSGMMNGLEDSGVFRTHEKFLTSNRSSFPRCISEDRMHTMGYSQYEEFLRPVIGKAYLVTDQTTQRDLDSLMAYEGWPDFYDLLPVRIINKQEGHTAMMFHANSAASVFMDGPARILTTPTEDEPVQWFTGKGDY